MTTTLDVQRALLARGYDIGRAGADGDMGPATLGAMLKALETIPLPVATVAPVPSVPAGVVPADWMPWARMQRIIIHWSAGANKVSAIDRKHYHLILDGEGNLVRGDHSIADNVSTGDGKYAAHTLGLNSGSIGVSLAGMAGATESPFQPGKSPITRAQWEKLPLVLADLCRRYAINVAATTVLSHAEVEKTLGIKQRGKWDIARLPFDPSIVGAKAVGDQFRAATKALL
ncbi:MAG TPA: N-acetylmuramoyl-L-alanine amidase [Bradyrhizobium sp.]|nr:N-acetylmuramoyl-L-alanine amidase [Bradyrhizobium sp.]